jgi:hypothetical protein
MAHGYSSDGVILIGTIADAGGKVLLRLSAAGLAR